MLTLPVVVTPDPATYSVAGNRRAEAFTCFAAPFMRGRLLDVGCGQASIPLYLFQHPIERIVGLDPVEAPHPFTFRQGRAEQMPFAPCSFDTVVCATALDHLDHAAHVSDALREIRRVLKPGGRFLSWETTVPPDEAGGDEHHAYRFTDDWLFDRWSDFFRPVALEWQREGMRNGCAEVFGLWERS